jgi:hypothetical protein
MFREGLRGLGYIERQNPVLDVLKGGKTFCRNVLQNRRAA